MAFEIGQRVTSSFTGPGTVTSEMVKDADGDVIQAVIFDAPILGARNWAVKKLSPLDEAKEKQKVTVVKSAAQIDFEVAQTEGLTYFETVSYDRDEADTTGTAFNWLSLFLSERGSRITVYATEKNATKTAKELAELLTIDLDKALDLVSVRERKTSGGAKWNVDFANDPVIAVTLRDALRVNFGHTYAKDRTPDIRRIRCGSKKLVQALIKAGFPVIRVYEADGETRKAAERGGNGS